MPKAGSAAAASSQLDVVFDGTWVMVPGVDANGKIIGVDVYSPSCGHPHGAYFTQELNPHPRPAAEAFYLLHEHGHRIDIARASGARTGMPLSGIDRSVNHVLSGKRPIRGNWDLMIAIGAGPDDWVSSDTVLPQTTDASGRTVPCFSGKDAPTGKVSSLQTLSFKGVTGVALGGVPAEVQALLPAPWSGSGSLIFAGEVPYIASIQHHRAAYQAMASLAGLDVALNHPLPAQRSAGLGPGRLGIKTPEDCTSALIVMP
jgi:hypothetical protein